MSEEKRYVLKVPMEKKDKTIFKKAFNTSGCITMAEFVRHIIREYVKGTK